MIDYIATGRVDPELDLAIEFEGIDRAYRDIPYETEDGHTRYLDLYLPEGAGPFPLILHVAGGGWYFSTKSSRHMGHMPETAVRRGYAVASIACISSQYEKFPAQIMEVKKALYTLQQQSGQWNLDPNWSCLWGNSSGGNLVLMAALSEERGEMPLAQGKPVVNAVVTLYPQVRMGQGRAIWDKLGLKPRYKYEGPRCAESIYLGECIENAPELCRRASPMEYLSGSMPPLVLLHGTNDHVVNYLDSLEFVQKYAARTGDGNVFARFVQGMDHSDKKLKSKKVCGKIMDMLDRTRRGESICPPEMEKRYFCVGDILFGE